MIYSYGVNPRRENDKLRSDNSQYQAAHDEKVFPLKKRVKILAAQLSEWAPTIEG
jgi:hypothetical protein